MAAEADRPRALRRVDPHRRRGRLYHAVCRFSAAPAATWFAVNVAWKVDPALLKLTRGRFSTAGPLPVALLESRGARSGLPRRNATLYFHDGERVTIVASKRGAPEHPAWYHNVRAHPEVTLYLRRRTGRYRARVVEGAERERLWKLITELNPGYDIYRARASNRQIPVVALSPV